MAYEKTATEIFIENGARDTLREERERGGGRKIDNYEKAFVERGASLLLDWDRKTHGERTIDHYEEKFVEWGTHGCLPKEVKDKLPK